ncbi:MAG: NAD-dependent epimerase/dehydratase family protein [Candidatus Rokubacteria bacterium]|nr:NAD-dependent epimerase/dehydratase family protein [Candidatus Rokubacteria bacterium]
MGIVLVTGGAGFIGSHLVDRLLESGTVVRVLDNLSTGSLRNLQGAADGRGGGNGPSGALAPGRRLELMIGDVRDDRLVRRAMRNAECVFHMAAVPPSPVALTNPMELHTVNVHGTLNVLHGAATEGVPRVVFASCASVYGPTVATPVGEDCPAHPVSVFAASKLAGEIYCRAYHSTHGLQTVALRYFSVYGPRQNGISGGALVPALIDTLRRRGRPLIAGDGRRARDFPFVDDAVEATRAAAVSPGAAGRVINVGSGQPASAFEVLDILKRLLRSDAVPRLRQRPTEPGTPMTARTTLATELLGCAPRVSLVSGLARSAQFFAEAERADEPLLAEVGSHEERADV